MTDTDRTPWRTESILPSLAGTVPVLHDRECQVESFLLDGGTLIEGAGATRNRRGLHPRRP